MKKAEKFKVDNVCLPEGFTKEEKEKLNDVISENGEYVIPVEWTVYSTVRVTNARNLAEAIAIVHQNSDEIPLDTEPEYVDGSYRVNLDNYEEAVLDYDEVGDKVTIDANDYDRDELEDEMER